MNNSIANLTPHLIPEWNRDRNKPNTVFNTAYKSNKKMWWICGVCSEEYETIVRHRSNGVGCPYCSGRKTRVQNSIFSTHNYLLEKWDFSLNKITPKEVSYGSQRKVFWKSEHCGHQWESSVKNMVRNSNCPICSSRKLLVGFNDLKSTNLQLFSLLKDKRDGEKYMEFSNKRVDWLCPSCDMLIKNKRISDINNYGLSCPRCSDGVSFPEKVMATLLKYYNIEFEREYSPTWAKGKKYDFFFELEGETFIVETHGKQHYNGGFSTLGGKTLEEEKENDAKKREMANSHIENYVELDCRNSTLDWMLNSLKNSVLGEKIVINEDVVSHLLKTVKDSVPYLCYLEFINGDDNFSSIGRKFSISSTTAKNYVLRFKIR